MFCSRCGAQNDDNAWRCTRCGSDLHTAPGGQSLVQVPSYLAHAILCTLLCCLPFGIVAIVYAAQVNSKLQAGDVVGARAASDQARKWCWVSFWVGLVWAAIVVIIQVLALASHWR